MERALALCSWDKRGFSLPALTAGASAMDATGQPAANIPPKLNVLAVEVWAPTAYVDSLGDAVVWRKPIVTVGQKPPADKPATKADLDAVKAKLAAMGAKPAEVDAAAGTSPTGTQEDMAAQVAAWLKVVPAAQAVQAVLDDVAVDAKG